MAWASLVLLAGSAVADLVASWSSAPRLLAAVFLWAGWGAVLLATLVPRPIPLVVLRVGTVLAALVAVTTIPSTDPGPAAAAVVGTVAVAAFALSPAVGAHWVNGPAYGDEQRFPLRVPPALLLGPLPLSVLVIGAGLVTGPLLLADGRFLLGGPALVAGWAATIPMGRSLYSLSQRWAVLVPAGIVLKDPLTMIDPVLFLRDHVVSLRPLPYPTAPADDILDLRLGAVPGSLVLELDEEAMLFKTSGRQRGGARVDARRLAFSPRSADALLADAARRKLAAAG